MHVMQAQAAASTSSTSTSRRADEQTSRKDTSTSTSTSTSRRADEQTSRRADEQTSRNKDKGQTPPARTFCRRSARHTNSLALILRACVRACVRCVRASEAKRFPGWNAQPKGFPQPPIHSTFIRNNYSSFRELFSLY